MMRRDGESEGPARESVRVYEDMRMQIEVA